MKSDAEQLTELAETLEAQRETVAQAETPGPVELRPLPPATRSDEERAALEQRQADARRAAEIRQHLAALVKLRGPRYADCQLSNFAIADGEAGAAQQHRIERLREYCASVADQAANGRGVMLIGGCGTGKDHLAMAVAKAFIHATAKPVVWTSGAMLFETLRDSFDGKRGEGEIVAPMVRAPLLWISDPLPVKGELTPYQAEALYRLIDARYNARRPMVVTANLAPGEGDKAMGPAIARRLRDATLVIHCNWPMHKDAKQ